MSASRGIGKRLGYELLRQVCRLLGVLLFRLRCSGRAYQQVTDGALVCANHQSYFDPVLVGLAFDRRLNYLARKSLFSVPGLRQLIEYLDAIPIDRDGLGLQGIKETLKRLKRGEIVLMFPEGRRTDNGEVSPLKPGFVALVRRARKPLIPVGLDGAFDAWPRNGTWPRLEPIHVCIGQPLTAHQIAQWTDEQVIAELERRIRQLHQQARRERRR
jgi:1-acyl-sn-glycerol-3-phosphate acyltransferase